MTPGATLCCALQTNTFMDYGGGYDGEWKNLVNKTQESLRSNNFYLPLLDVNFRNSSLIFESSNSIKKDGTRTNTSDNVQNVLGTTATGTTLTQTPVHQLHFNWQLSKEYQSNLNDIIKHTTLLFQKEVSSQNIPFVVLYDESRFTMDLVYIALKSCLQAGLNVYRYPVQSVPDPEIEINQFISQNKGCLLTSQLLFKGAEAENIISLQSSNAVSSNVRGTILRSVARLYIINGMGENQMMTINNVKNDDSFLHCFENCHTIIYECTTCTEKADETLMVCFPCKIKCHTDHKLEYRYIPDLQISGKCVCQVCHS